jgi:outer membrane biosynthesis protein TonB
MRRFDSTPRATQLATRAVFAALITLSFGCKKSDTTTPDDAAPEDESSSESEPEPAPAEEEEPAEVALDPGSFEEAINEHMSDIADCYTTANASNPELKGEMNTLFTIGPDGKISEFKVEEGSSLNDEGLTQCIIEKSKTWQFPKPASGEAISLPFPFNLEPG